MSDIKPALTPEEWAELRIAPLSTSIAIHDDGDGIEIVTYPDAASRDAREGMLDKFKIESWETEAIHGVAALCLNGQPFGFTHAQLEAIRLAAKVFRKRGLLANDGGVDLRLLDDLADRIAALLPPEKP